MKKKIFWIGAALLFTLFCCTFSGGLRITEPVSISAEEQRQNYSWRAYDVQKGERYCFWKGECEIYVEDLETGASEKIADKRGLFANRIHNMIVNDSLLIWTEKGSYETDDQGIYVKKLLTGGTEHICREYAVGDIFMADDVLYFKVNGDDLSAVFYSYSFEQKRVEKLFSVPHGATGFYSWSVYNEEMFYAYMDDDDVYIDSLSVKTGERRLHLPSKAIFGERDSLDCFKIAEGYLMCNGFTGEENMAVVYDLNQQKIISSIRGYLINDYVLVNGKAYFLAQDEENEAVYVLQVEPGGTVSNKALLCRQSAVSCRL